MQHFQVFGVRIVAGKSPVELAVEGHDLDAQRFEERRREAARRPVAAGRDDLHLAHELGPAGLVGDVAGGKVGHEFISPAGLGPVVSADHDVAQAPHFLGSEGHRPGRAHLDARPAVVVVRSGHHRHRRRVERKLRKISHRRDRKPDVAHFCPAAIRPAVSASLIEAE